jgi:3-hydroxy-9,10-secoandrosta-1,3,5(10)-triene-9,17-dione monooxygenase
MDGSVSTPTGKELVARVTALGPKLLERRLKAAHDRRLDDTSIQELVDTQVFRACLPKRWGGFELPFGTHTDVAMEAARFCGSTGWVMGIIGSHSWWIAKCKPEVQEEIFATGPDTLIGGAFNSTSSKAEKKDGGYVISGEWVFASGSLHCPWAAVAGVVPREGTTPDFVMFLLPRKDFEIRDVWHPPGLRGTGSNTIVAQDLFVPEHRTISFMELGKTHSVGQSINPGWTFRLPMTGVVHYSVAGPVIGMARGALDGFIDHVTGRNSLLSKTNMQKLTNIQLRAAEASAEVFAAQSIYDADLLMMREAAQADRELTKEEHWRIRRNCGYIGTLTKQATRRLAEALGGTGLRDDHRVHMAAADTMAASAHMAVSWDMGGIPYGKLLLGLDPMAKD